MSRQLCTKATNVCSLSERYGRGKDPKNIKLPKTGVKKKNRPGFPFVCTCGPNTTLKFQIDFSEIGRGFAELPFFCSLSLDMYGIHFGNNLSSYLMGGEFGNETCIDIFSVYTIADG